MKIIYRISLLFAVIALFTGGDWQAFAANPAEYGFPDTYVQIDWREMGDFENGTWAWDTEAGGFLNTWINNSGMSGTDPNTQLPLTDPIPSDEDLRVAYEPIQGIQVRSKRLDLRRYPDGRQDVRVTVNIGDVLYPVMFWGDDGLVYYPWQPPIGCEPNDYQGVCWCAWQVSDDGTGRTWCEKYMPGGVCTEPTGDPEDTCGWIPYELDFPEPQEINPCCGRWYLPHMELGQAGSIDLSTTSLHWVQKGLSAPVDSAFQAEVTRVRYDQSTNFWTQAGAGSDRGIVFIYQDQEQELLPDLGENTFELTVDGETIDLTFNVPDLTALEEMPMVPAMINQKVETKSGKAIKGLSNVEVDNITVRELNGNLIIQWAEPDAALTPGLQLKFYIGRNATWPEVDYYLWVDSPVQMGTVVVPAYIWGPFKAQLIDLGDTDCKIQGMYRAVYGNFHNRGYFDTIEFPLY